MRRDLRKGPARPKKPEKPYRTHRHCRRVEVEPASSVSAYITRDRTELTKSPSKWIALYTRRSSP
jgi:hypothetical protein